MELTGKAKESFIDYLDKTNQIKIEKGILNLHWQDLPEKFKNALIIEWFDSVGIYITSDYFELNNGFYSEILDSNFEIIKLTRQEALTEAIKKANEIYNEK
jgi:hypothetical protein